jgi:acyl-CoA synthetase (NDP forming)/RimJ/RimL family protein N-acetyltransferase
VEPSHPAYPGHWEADVVLRDGGTARVRPITPDDAERLVAFYTDVSDQSKYFRFFAPYPRLSDRDVRHFTHHDYDNRVGLAALVRDEFIATVRYDRIDESGRPSGTGTAAEVAFLVQDAHQGRGIASALLEHIAAVARERGIRRFIAEVLPENRKMGKVFTDAGYTQRRSFAEGVLHFELDLEPTEESLAVMRSREHRAEARSTQRLLAPRSVVVIGAGRNPDGVGRSVLRNLLAAGFTGEVYAVSRSAEPGQLLDGAPAFRGPGELPAPADLAVVAVPAAEVPAVVAECGAAGVQGLVVITAGYAETGTAGRARQRDLVRQARAAGMRVLGPNAFGLINTDPGSRLNASLSPLLPARGPLGIFSQSGAIGAALLEAADRRGLGVSSFASAGNRADVSGNDLLQFWEEDEATRVVLLYLESFGNPRKFSRLARRVAAAKPIVVIKGGRHTGSVPAGHAQEATKISDSTVDTLFQQAGVVRVDTITELYDAADLLAHQPPPRGDRIAVVGNSDSLGLLTHDAALSAGLRPLPPQDLTTSATPDDLAAGLAAAVDRPDVDAVIAVVIPPIGAGSYPLFPGSGLLRSGSARPDSLDAAPFAEVLRAAAARALAAGKPLLLSHLALPELAAALHGTVPAYPRPERAVRALAHATRRAAWCRDSADTGRIPELDGISEAPARRQVADALSRASSVRLGEDAAATLLAHYGIPVLRTLRAPDEQTAVRAAAALGYPVALKATAPGLRHRADLGSVRLDLADKSDLRRAYRESVALLGADADLVVQPMVARGVDTTVSATVDPAIGAILSFGLAGAASELLGDVAHRLIPATDRSVAGLVREIKAAPLLFGWRGAEPVDTGALEELLLRVSQLVDDIPEVASVELEPVVVAPRGLAVLGASVRLAHLPARTDLGPRTLGRL